MEINICFRISQYENFCAINHVKLNAIIVENCSSYLNFKIL